MSDELQRRLELADGVLATAAELEPGVLELIAQALTFGRGPLAGVGQAFDSLAGGSKGLARLQLAYALRKLARDDELVVRLAEASSQPWRSLGHAVAAVAADPLAA